MNWYRLLRPLLFACPPEVAHRLVLNALHFYGLIGKPRTATDFVEVAGLKFKNRVGLAAGFDKNGEVIPGAISLGFGFIEVGTTTLRSQSGNEKPRLFRVRESSALINRMGFNNKGVDAICSRLELTKRTEYIPIGVNIGKNRTTTNEEAINDYTACISKLYPYVDYFNINISSPNTPDLRTFESARSAETLLGTLIKCRNQHSSRSDKFVPLFVKISPDIPESHLADLVNVFKRVGCDGIVATNTTLTRPSLVQPRFHEEGGLSGVPLFPLSLKTVSIIREVAGPGYPIIGVGGITTAKDGLMMRKAGADLIQVYTGLVFQGPRLIRILMDAVGTT